MALIKCPECGKTISDKALKCPQCGYPITQKVEQEPAALIAEKQLDEVPGSHPNPIAALACYPRTLSKKAKAVLAIAGVIVIAVLCVLHGIGLFGGKVTVKNISIEKWRLTDSSSYSDVYEGQVTSDQKRPFIALIGSYEDKDIMPKMVYMENGVGTLEVHESDDPSTIYKPIGYLSGKSIKDFDISVEYSDSDYFDYSYSSYTTCTVEMNISLKQNLTGLLLFDISNETNNEEDCNRIVTVVNGKAEYSYYASLPYKARGIDLSVTPRMLCTGKSVSAKDFTISKEYTAEKSSESDHASYSGEQIMSFPDYDDGLILYTEELKEGGTPKNRNECNNTYAFLHNSECTFSTYDSVDGKQIILPKYSFNIVGYIPWTLLDKEIA